MTHDSMTSTFGGHRPFDRRTDGRRFLGVRVGEEDSLPGGSRNRKKKRQVAGCCRVMVVGCWW